MIGIYKIENKVNGKVYIGQSIDIEKRWKNHISYLNKGIHRNKHLSQSYFIEQMGLLLFCSILPIKDKFYQRVL